MLAILYLGVPSTATPLEPVQAAERYTILDLLRGFALFGVLLVNLLYFFRVSLFALKAHSHPGFVNYAVDMLVAWLLEFKAFDLFSLTFGIGVAVQAERAFLRRGHVELFLVRRFLILLAVGLCHLLLVSNVNILALYALCGMLLIPLLRLPSIILAVAGISAIFLPAVFPLWPMLPPEAIVRASAAEAMRTYSGGTFGEILMFRWRETQLLITPLLISSAQKTIGLMLLGVAIWRFGIIKNPQRYRYLLWVACLGAGALGTVKTKGDALSIWSHVPLALAYGAGLLLWQGSARATTWTAPVAAAGRMALSNYLMQSFVFALIFYGYGFGLFGKLPPAPVAVFGIAFYAGQLAFSVWWLQRYRFGPFEWLWRSLTYGRRQRMTCSMLH